MLKGALSGITWKCTDLAQSTKNFKKKIIATKLFILIKISYILNFFIYQGLIYKIKDSKSLCFLAQPGIVNKKFK